MTVPSVTRALAITIGAGRTRPRGGRLGVEGTDPILALAQTLAALPPAEEQWWCGSVFRDDYRKEENWEGADLLGMDLDYRDKGGKHAPLSSSFRERLGARLNLPGNLAHATPRGARVVFLLERTVHDLETWRAAARGAVKSVKSSLASHGLAARAQDGRCDGLTVDDGASVDPARLWWAPRAIVNGERRSAEIVLLNPIPHAIERLVALGHDGIKAKLRPAPRRIRDGGGSRYGLAVLRHACEKIEGAREGGRHETLKRRAHLVAGYVAGGEIEESLALDCLLSAALGSGLPEREASALLDWAFESGKERPLAAAKKGGRR